MGLKAKNDFPEIKFSKSIIVGNQSQIYNFEKNFGLKTVFVGIIDEIGKVDCFLIIKLLTVF